MSQTLNQLKNQVEAFCDNYFAAKQSNKQKALGHLQKIQGSYSTLTFRLRFPGKTVFLYFGRGKGTEGIWFSEKGLPPELRAKDFFIDFLKKHLLNSYLTDLRVHPNDRLLILSFKTVSQEMELGLFYKGPELFFLLNSDKTFCSWKGFWDGPTNLEDEFIQIGLRQEADDRQGNRLASLDDILKKENKKKGKSPKRAGQRKKNKLKKILEDINRAKAFIKLEEKLHDESLKLEESLSIAGKKVKFPNLWSYHKRRDHLFQKIKSYKKGLEIQTKRYEDLENQPNPVFQGKPLPPIAPIWKTVKKRKAEVVGEKGLAFTLDEMNGRLGRNALENDYLRVHWCKKENYWIHFDEMAGPHIFLKSSSPPSADQLQALGSMMRDIVGESLLEIALVYTKVRYLKGVKGAPGKVRFKNEKRMTVSYDQKWDDKIKK